MTWVEGGLRFDFSTAMGVEKLDEKGAPIPVGMSLVDFVVEEPKRRLLIEIKDPCQNPKSTTPSAMTAITASRNEYLVKLSKDGLINDELTPKARDSYTLLHLQKRDDKPMVFVCLLGVDCLPLDPGLLPRFTDRLRKRLRQETDQVWAREYVTDCLVLTETTWSRFLSHYPLQRISETP